MHLLSECYISCTIRKFPVPFLNKNIDDHVAIDQMSVNACSGSFILKTHSSIHNQLTAEKFSSLIKYARYSSGYILKDSRRFENVYNVCFSFDDDLCSMTACSDFSFTCCSHYHRILTCL